MSSSSSSSAPLTKHPKSIQRTLHPPSMPAYPSPSPRKRRNICICIGAAVLILLLLLLTVLILALTVFKAKQPITTLNSVALADLAVSLDIDRLAVDVNLTLIADVSIRNPNKVGFKYTNSTAHLNYRGEMVGEAPIPADHISADNTKQLNITLTIMADRLLANSNLYSDVASGSLPFNAYTRVSGKVAILGGIKVHVVSSASCDFIVYISNTSIGYQHCNFHNNL